MLPGVKTSPSADRGGSEQECGRAGLLGENFRREVAVAIVAWWEARAAFARYGAVPELSILRIDRWRWRRDIDQCRCPCRKKAVPPPHRPIKDSSLPRHQSPTHVRPKPCGAPIAMRELGLFPQRCVTKSSGGPLWS